MALSKKEINRQREMMMKYDYIHLYNYVKYGVQRSLQPIDHPIKEAKAGANQAEYGVRFVNGQGKKVTQRFSSLEKAQAMAEIHNGFVMRLGGAPRSPFDSYRYKPDTSQEGLTKAHIDESGAVEFIEQPLEIDPDVASDLTSELNALGAIQYKGTRPSADVLYKLHKRHPEMSFKDFAAAVILHCEIPPVKENKPQSHQARPFRSYEDKEAWYLTPAGQQWLKKHSVPAIMMHTKEDYFEWKSLEQRES